MLAAGVGCEMNGYLRAMMDVLSLEVDPIASHIWLSLVISTMLSSVEGGVDEDDRDDRDDRDEKGESSQLNHPHSSLNISSSASDDNDDDDVMMSDVMEEEEDALNLLIRQHQLFQNIVKGNTSQNKTKRSREEMVKQKRQKRLLFTLSQLCHTSLDSANSLFPFLLQSSWCRIEKRRRELLTLF